MQASVANTVRALVSDVRADEGWVGKSFGLFGSDKTFKLTAIVTIIVLLLTIHSTILATIGIVNFGATQYRKLVPPPIPPDAQQIPLPPATPGQQPPAPGQQPAPGQGQQNATDPAPPAPPEKIEIHDLFRRY